MYPWYDSRCRLGVGIEVLGRCESGVIGPRVGASLPLVALAYGRGVYRRWVFEWGVKVCRSPLLLDD